MANYLLIAGDSSIGQECTKLLQKANHQVIITGRDAAKTTNIAKAQKVPFKILDAANFDDTNNVFSQVISEYGPIDGVVNFAGSLLLKPAHLTSQNEYASVINDNLTTAFSVVKACAKHMSNAGGSVVLMSSAVAGIGVANHEAIAAAKSAVIGLALAAAASYASNNIRFNVIAPGLTDTNLTKSITGNETSLKFSTAMHALGRIGKASEIASGVVFFLSPENSWITAQVLAIDGGLSNVRPKAKV
jgi:NAD(P)-dependent dehydrogenase (short-subunit alcohol dehydrogenase family)